MNVRTVRGVWGYGEGPRNVEAIMKNAGKHMYNLDAKGKVYAYASRLCRRG